MSFISEEQRIHWMTKGWVILNQTLDASVRALVPSWVDDLVKPGPDKPRRLHYYEEVDGRVQICRTERFIEDHSDLRKLITRGAVINSVAELLGTSVHLYKEKVNYKLAGGAGFRPHQDATAYDQLSHHITCLIAVDPMTSSNGCLELSDYSSRDLLETDGDGCLSDKVVTSLIWKKAELRTGDILCFSSFTPHKSGANLSGESRRAIYLTYNAAAEGDLRESYYEKRASQMAEQESDSYARISNIGHFEGRSVKT